MADEDIIEIDTDSLEIALLQSSRNITDSTTTTLQSSSSLSDKSAVSGGSGIPLIDSSDDLHAAQMHSTIRPTLIRQAKSKHCESSETSPDISSIPSSGSILKRQRTYSTSSSSTSSR